MSLKTEKDRAKAQQEKFQAVLSNLLKDDDNKYCVDCDAKGPRWASWNLGLFLCIRCAGIHRNLGVHISRVKSVNLDSWTPEQVAMMQEMGNSRARAVYEANIPDGFRRPQTDSALEAFIRAKYEQKKYIAREWVPPKPVVPKDYYTEWLDDDKTDKKKLRSKPTSNISLSSSAVISQPAVHNSPPEEAKPTVISATSAKPQSLAQPQTQVPKPKTGSDDLLGLEAEMPPAGSGGHGGDLLEDLFGGSPSSSSLQGSSGQQDFINCQQNGNLDGNLFDGGSSEVSGGKKTAKDSIMALYGSGSQQQMFGVPGGMYMPQQMYGSGIGPMIGQPMTQMPQGMIGMQQPPVYGAMGQMVPQQMPRGMMGSQAPPMMGQGGMGGQLYMQQPRNQAQITPQMQQMQYQQMQQQMAAMRVGGGPVTGMQQAPAASWGSAGTGQTLSTNLWQ